LLLNAGTVGGFALLALIGFFCIGNFSITVVMGQELLPTRAGVASGVTLGAAIGAGGLIATALGLVADHAGLMVAMLVIAGLPLPTVALALALPPTGRPRTRGSYRRCGLLPFASPRAASVRDDEQEAEWASLTPIVVRDLVEDPAHPFLRHRSGL
jgi:hypothetical protein